MGLGNEGLQSQPVGTIARGSGLRTRASRRAPRLARAREAVPVSFPVEGAERAAFEVPGDDLRRVAHVLDGLAHRWGEASAEMPEGRVRTKKGRGGGLRKLIVVSQIEDDLRRKLDPKDRSWRVHIVDGGGHYFWKANWQVLKFGAGWIAARFADGKYVEALPEGGRCRNAAVAMRLADEAMADVEYAEVDG